MRKIERYDWFITGWLIALHVGCIAAPFCFTWSGLAIFAVLSVISGLAITLGFHRLLTHRGFDCRPWFRRLMACLGGLAGQGGCIQWVADHRAHHRFADMPGFDPHTPREGWAWAHVIWSCPWKSEGELDDHFHQYSPDLMEDSWIRTIHQQFLLHNVMLGVALATAGGIYGGPLYAASWLVWGLVLRMVYVLHTTWFVNSVTHGFGYRNYDCDDDSTNLWWVALTTMGEGWHNNHHAHPVACNHGRRWFEFDLTWVVIRALEFVGIAWNVKKAPRLPEGPST